MRRLDLPPVGGAPPGVISGAAWIQAVARPAVPSRLVVDDVTFAPGSCTVWHSHPFGQLLLVTAGAGWLQARDQDRVEVRSGDVVWIEPGEEHRHGAAADHLLRHLSIQEHDDGTTVVVSEPLVGGHP